MSCSSNTNNYSKTKEKLYEYTDKIKNLKENYEILRRKYLKLSEDFEQLDTSHKELQNAKIENEGEFYNIIDELQMKNRQLQKELDEKDKILDSVRGLVN